MQQTYSKGGSVKRVTEGLRIKDILKCIKPMECDFVQQWFSFKGSGICNICESHHHQHRCSNWLCTWDNTNHFVLHEENNAYFSLFVFYKKLRIYFFPFFPPLSL